ncbi:ferredoxin reductase family protein [Catelliglobosispora koreensis]|uniref:ferredoxin reductase family protein n=1 Tax=Catelliglobosispora koreensis TaxID=129052 RepID=UPI00036237D2|nr:ferredoxin reductase family protein [Catelliglobosispora koreensis]
MTMTAEPLRTFLSSAPVAGRRAAPRWWGRAAIAGALFSLLAAVALWASNGGIGELASGGAQAIVAGGRLGGLIASNLLLLQVLLMARIPFVERSFGQDRLARWHRWTGFTSFHLMLAHLVLITVGYALPFRTNAFSTFFDLVLTYPGMLLAAAGSALLVMVVVISIRAARRRLRYESWHLLHLYAYLGVGLALPHQLWNGADFLHSPAATVYWWGLYATAVTAVIVFRVLLPLWRNAKHRLEIADVVSEGPGLTSVYLRGRQLGRLPARAGQFFLWRFRDGPGWSRAHPFSLSASPREDMLRITVKAQGDGSDRVASLRPGTRVLAEGPFGKLTGETYTGGPVTMFACGIGITPLLALLWELPYQEGEATLVYRIRYSQDLAFRSELDYLAEQRGLRLIVLAGRRADRASWLPAGFAEVTDVEALRQIAPDIAEHHIYVCGPELWTQLVQKAAKEAGVPGKRLRTERFAW